MMLKLPKFAGNTEIAKHHRESVNTQIVQF